VRLGDTLIGTMEDRESADYWHQEEERQFSPVGDAVGVEHWVATGHW